MNVNNQMYKMFEHMINGYKDGNTGAIENGAHCWLMFDPENPFPANTPEHEAFYKMKMCFTIWNRGDINGRINKRRMLEWAIKLCALNPAQPYVFDKKAEEEEKRAEQEKRIAETEKKIQEQKMQEQKKQEEKKQEGYADSKYVLFMMTEAYNSTDDVSFKQYALHLMEITPENIFAENTPEYAKFAEMLEAYSKHNMRKVHVAAGELCQIINKTEVKPQQVKTEEPQKDVQNEEKKSWFKFLHPWR